MKALVLVWPSGPLKIKVIALPKTCGSIELIGMLEVNSTCGCGKSL